MDTLDLPDLSQWPKPLELCKEGKFDELFKIYEALEKCDLTICGYQPSDFLEEESADTDGFVHNEDSTTGVHVTKMHNSVSELSLDGHSNVHTGDKNCTLYQPIHYAAAHGDLMAVQTLIEKYCCSRSLYDFHPTPLALACHYGQFKVAQYFIEELHCGSKSSDYLLQLTCNAGSVNEPITGRLYANSNINQKDQYKHNLISKMGSGHLQILHLLLLNFNFSSLPISILEVAMLHGDLEDFVKLSKVFKDGIDAKEFYLEKFLIVLFITSNVQIVHFILSNNMLEISTKLIWKAYDNYATLHVVLMILKHFDRKLIFEHAYFPENISLFSFIVKNSLQFYATDPFLDNFQYELIVLFGNAQNSSQQNLLHLACTSCSIQTAKLLTRYKPQLCNQQDANLQLPLHIMCSKRPEHYSYNILELLDLVSEDCDVNCQDKDGNTPLMIAFSRHNIQVARHLYKHKKPSLVVKNNRSCIPFMRYKSIESMLEWDKISLGDVNAKYEGGNTLLHYACNHFDLKLIRHLTGTLHALIDQKNASGNLPLHNFLKLLDRNQWKVEDLQVLSKKSIVNWPDEDGNTPLHILCSGSWEANFTMKFTAIKYLILELNTSINIPNSQGWLPLHMIANSLCDTLINTSFEMVIKVLDLLINNDTINAQTKCGYTALHLILKLRNSSNRLSLIQHLVDKKHASTTIYDANGLFPLHYLAREKEVDCRLLKVLTKSSDINAPDKKGNSLLHRVCMFVHEDIIIYLIKDEGAFINVQNDDGKLPLHIALYCGCTSMRVIRLLMNDTNLHTVDKQGNTPLSIVWSLHKEFRNSLALFPILVNYNLIELINSFTSVLVRENVFEYFSKSCHSLLQRLIDFGSILTIRYYIKLFSLNYPKYNQILCNKLCLNSLVFKLMSWARCENEVNYDPLFSLVNACNVNNKDNEGKTILHVLSKSIHTASLLSSFHSMTPEGINLQDKSGKTPLHYACKAKNTCAIHYILGRAESVSNIKDKDDNIPLHYCTRHDCVDLLPVTNEDLHSLNSRGLSPIDQAIVFNNLDAAYFLLLKHGNLCDQKLGNCVAVRHDALDHELYDIYSQLVYSINFERKKQALLSAIKVLKCFVEQGLELTEKVQLFLTRWTSQLKFNETKIYDVDNEIMFPNSTFSFQSAPFNILDRDKLMHAAAWNGRTDILKYLICDVQCDPNATDLNGFSSLAYACQLDGVSFDYDVITWDDWIFPSTKKDYCIKRKGVSEDSIMLLIESGCSIFEAKMGVSLFEMVCLKQDLDLLKMLVSSCDTINSQDDHGYTPLMLLLKTSSESTTFLTEAMKYLIEDCACDQKIESKDKSTALLLAIKCGLPFEVVTLMDFSLMQKNMYLVSVLESYDLSHIEEFILEVPLDDCMRQLLFSNALQLNKKPVILLLMKYVVSIADVIHVFSESKESPPDLLIYCLEHFHEFEKNSVHLQCNTEVDSSGNTLLHLICKYNIAYTFKQLMKHWTKSTFERVNHDCNTPLHIACENDSTECVKLMRSGKLNSKNHVGDTPLHLCCKQKNWSLLDFLLSCPKFSERNCALCTKNNALQYPLYNAIETFKDRPPPWGMMKVLFYTVKLTAQFISNNDYGTVVHLICKSSSSTNLKILQYLASHNAKLDCLDDQNRVPLHYAASVSLELVKLCFYPFAIDIKDNYGDTPLHIACIHGNLEIIDYLVTEKKFDVMAQNFVGETPLHKACKSDNLTSEILNVLLGSITTFHCDQSENYPLHILCEHFSISKLPCLSLLVERIQQCKDKDSISKPNKFYETPLHFLCKSKIKEAFNAVEILLPLSHCINIRTLSGDTPLHFACMHGRHDIVELLLKIFKIDISITNQKKETPLHAMCSAQLTSTCILDKPNSFEESIKFVDAYVMLMKNTLNGLATNDTINAENSEGNTPLHCFLLNNESIISIPYVNIDSINNLSCKITECLLKLGASCDKLNNNRELPIHLACKNQIFEVIKLVCTCNNSRLTCSGDSILHCACTFTERSVNDIQSIIQVCLEGKNDLLYKRNTEGNFPLHLVCLHAYHKEELIRYMIDNKCNINWQNYSGDTPLHLLLNTDRDNGFILHLILNDNYNPFLANNNEITFLDNIADQYNQSLAETLFFAYFCDSENLSKLLKHAKFVLLLLLSKRAAHILIDTQQIDPSLLYRAHYNFFKGQCTPPTVPIPILFIGDSMTGKTTLIQSLKKEIGIKVSESSPDRTAGVIPSSFRSEKYGDVTAYDFAGQREYYASHETVMQSILQRLPPIVIINVKLNDPMERIKSIIVYWINFIENRLKALPRKAHLIIVYSHADLVKSENPTILSQGITKSLSKLLQPVFEKVESVAMDCRKFQGEAMHRLVSMLTKSSNAIRHEGVLNFNAHCILVFLVHNFKNKVALRLGEIFAQFNRHKDHDPALSLLPRNLANLLELFEELSSTGQILLIKDESIYLRSWIVLNKEVLLSEITGKIFAPPEFSVHENSLCLSQTGVILFSTIRKTFRNHDPNMIVAFLQSIEYCYEIKDDYIIAKLFKISIETHERYYFFPALVIAEHPSIVWYSLEAKPIQFGWVLKSMKKHQYFTPKFIQSLLLRLVFGKTKITSKPVLRQSFEGVESISRIWKSGLHWADGNGIDTFVDIDTTSSKVFACMCCETEQKDRFLEHRSSLMKTIRNLAREQCSAVETADFFVHHSHIKDCLKNVDSSDKYFIPMGYVCEAADNSQPYVQTPLGSFKTIDFVFLDIQHSLYFTLTEQLFGRMLEEKNIQISANSCAPSLRDLYILKWQDKDGQEKEFRLVEKVSSEWMEFGYYLGIEMNLLKAWKQEFVGSANLCWNQVMEYWRSGRDKQHYPPTWEGLYELLNDAKLASLAVELKNAVECAFSKASS